MDFVIAGFGLGSLAVLAGILLADRGAFWRPGRDPASLGRSARARGLGRLLAVGGGILIGLTVVGLLLPGGDRAGTILVLLGIVALALAAAASTAGAFGRASAPPAAAAGRAAPAARGAARPRPPRAPMAAPRGAPLRQAPPPDDRPAPDRGAWAVADDPLAWFDDPLFAPSAPEPAMPRRTVDAPPAGSVPAARSWPDDPDPDPGFPGEPAIRPRPGSS